MALSKIITEELLPSINNAIQQLDTFDAEYELARRANLIEGPQGATLQDLKTKADAARERLMAIKGIYFPGQ